MIKAKNKILFIPVSLIITGVHLFMPPFPSLLKAQELEWHSFEKALAIADTSDQPILVDVWAPWCGWCHKLKKEVYPKLAPLLRKEFVLARINRAGRGEIYYYKSDTYTTIELAQKLKANILPTITLLSSDGNYVLHITGFMNAKQIRPVLMHLASSNGQR